MNANFLAMSVGNTRTAMGAFVEDVLTSPRHVDNASLEAVVNNARQCYEQIESSHDPVVLLASVNPPLAAQIEEKLSTQLAGVKLLRAERDVAIPIGRQLDRETIVGEDRLLCAAAAYDRLKQACVIVDAGTAVTVDFVDGAGTFHGGAIAPGVRMSLEAMHRGAAQLPQVQMQRPLEPIGHNTVEAMRTAVFHGMRGLVRELVEQYAQVAGAFPMVVATGGDAELLFRDFELIDRLVPDLALHGLAAAYRAAMIREDSL